MRLKMRYRKVYGQSKENTCLFCGKQSTRANEQGVPVCNNHKNAILNDFKCACGEWLDIKQSKYGIFFVCINCGPVSLAKALSVNQVWDENNLPGIDDL